MMSKSAVIKAKNGKIAQVAAMQALGEERKNLLPRGFVTLFDQIAKDGFYHRNYYFQCLAEAFPHHNPMWYVDRFYPHADCGPLAIDDGGHLDDLETMKLKKKILSKAGIKYILLTPETTLMTAMEQLA